MGLISAKVFQQVFGRNQKPATDTVTEADEKLMGPDFAALKKDTAKGVAEISQHKSTVLSIQSRDDLTLKAHYYPAEKATGKTVLCVHGYNSCGITDYANVALEYLSRGLNVLLPDNRACGDSEGQFASFGLKESEDTQLWIDQLVQLNPNCQILLQGCSMGAATVCMLASRKLPANVIGIVSDCSFSDASEQFVFTIKNFIHLPVKPVMSMLNKEYFKHFKAPLSSCCPLHSVAQAKLPMFFVNGKLDRYVPVENAQALYDACSSPKQLMLVEKSGHAAAHLYGGKAYYDNILSFFEPYWK